MIRNHHNLSRLLSLGICILAGALLQAQEKRTKTYNESFTVKPDAEVAIDVSHADITFETWDKDQVSVEAIIEVEGATEEEAKQLFDHGAIKIVGNSSLVEIKTSSTAPFPPMPPQAFAIEVPELPDMEPFFMDLHIPDLPPLPAMPPMPPAPVPNFDYEAYREDGEKYLKEWKKEFDKNFDKEYRKELEAWSKEMAEGAEKRNQHIQKWQEEHEKRMEEHEKRMEERQAEREAFMEQHKEVRERAREEAEKAREEARKIRHDIVITRRTGQEAPLTFFRSSDKLGGKSLKIKKTIRIKMPKSVKLKMNVRHGEVKLAETTRNIQATLSYARLLASTIDGEKTAIMASYSPVDVRQWNLGSLQTDFSDQVSLREVKSLKLKANSSVVTIERLLKNAKIENNLGSLHIRGVAENFEDMDIMVRNGEFILGTPATSYRFKFQGTSSGFNPPSNLNLTKSGDQKQTVYTGYYLNNNSPRSIQIDSRFSEVTLKQ